MATGVSEPRGPEAKVLGAFTGAMVDDAVSGGYGRGEDLANLRIRGGAMQAGGNQDSDCVARHAALLETGEKRRRMTEYGTGRVMSQTRSPRRGVARQLGERKAGDGANREPGQWRIQRRARARPSGRPEPASCNVRVNRVRRSLTTEGEADPP